MDSAGDLIFLLCTLGAYWGHPDSFFFQSFLQYKNCHFKHCSGKPIQKCHFSFSKGKDKWPVSTQGRIKCTHLASWRKTWTLERSELAFSRGHMALVSSWQHWLVLSMPCEAAYLFICVFSLCFALFVCLFFLFVGIYGWTQSYGWIVKNHWWEILTIGHLKSVSLLNYEGRSSLFLFNLKYNVKT